MASANLFVDWGGEFHNPPWQANNNIPIVVGQTTAYDLFLATEIVPPLAIQSQGSGQGIFITAIDGVVQNQSGNGYWWTYYINTQPAQVGCDAYLLQDGDSIAWDYQHFSSGFKQPNHPGLDAA